MKEWRFPKCWTVFLNHAVANSSNIFSKVTLLGLSATINLLRHKSVTLSGTNVWKKINLEWKQQRIVRQVCNPALNFLSLICRLSWRLGQCGSSWFPSAVRRELSCGWSRPDVPLKCCWIHSERSGCAIESWSAHFWWAGALKRWGMESGNGCDSAQTNWENQMI